MKHILYIIICISFFSTSLAQTNDINTVDAFKNWESKIINTGIPDIPPITIENDQDKKSNQISSSESLKKLFEEANKTENTAKYSYNTKDINNQSDFKGKTIPSFSNILIIISFFLLVLFRNNIINTYNNIKSKFIQVPSKENIAKNDQHIEEIINSLKEIENLKNSGVISTLEFEKLKSKILKTD